MADPDFSSRPELARLVAKVRTFGTIRHDEDADRYTVIAEARIAELTELQGRPFSVKICRAKEGLRAAQIFSAWEMTARRISQIKANPQKFSR